MSDIFREVEEDVRRERAEKLWKRYGAYIITLGVLVFVGIGGWQLWERYDRQEREKISAQFMAAQRISNPRDAANAFVDLAGNKGYGVVARLSQASAMFVAGQRKEAIDLYKEIAAADNGPVGSVARLRAAWALAETASRGELTELLKPLDRPGSPWRENAHEVLAFADYKALDLKSAQAKYAALAVNPEAPDALKARAKAMADYLKTGGAITYGAVPPEAVPLPPQAVAAPATPQ